MDFAHFRWVFEGVLPYNQGQKENKEVTLMTPIYSHFRTLAPGLACVLFSVSGCTSPGTPAPAPVVRVTQQTLGDCAQEVLHVTLNNQTPTQVSTEIISPGAFKHQFRVITLDTTGITSGTLKIKGVLGSKTQGSFALTSASPNYPCQGASDEGFSSAANVEPGSTFTLSHPFQQGQVFRLLSEGSWQEEAGTENTVQWTFQVE